MIHDIRQNLDDLDGAPVPRALGLLRVGPAGMLVPLLRSFLRSSAAAALNTDTPAAFGELDLIAEQLRR
jgi:2-dehydropantoate 2-reductase